MAGKSVLSLLAAAGALSALAYNPNWVVLDCTTDKNPVTYDVGEKMVFTVRLKAYNAPLKPGEEFRCRWTLEGDDGEVDCSEAEISEAKPVVVETSSRVAGFVRLTSDLIDAKTGKKLRTLTSSAGADVDKIVPAAEEPADFDEFWARMRKELDAVKLVATVKEVAATNLPKAYRESHVLKTVSVTCAGPRPVTGFLTMPKNAKPKSLPVTLVYDGYGFGAKGAIPAEWEFRLARDRAVFHVNAHGYELMREKAYYDEFEKARPGYAFSTKENAKPETAYFRGMAYRVMRSLEFAKTLECWDGVNLVAQGGSQGGLQTAWAGSLEPQLSLCRPHVTWCSDIAGVTIGRIGGWMPEFRAGLAYYDTVFHARRIPNTCRLEISRAGLGDYTCPPSGLAAEYNAANCEKSIVWVQNSTHGHTPEGELRHSYTNSAPAGRGIVGRAHRAAAETYTGPLVKARFADVWTLQTPDGERVIEFGGRARLRGSLKPMTVVTLKSVLVAEDDGVVALGCGADWWWLVRVNGAPVIGRAKMFPNGNAKSSCRLDDWEFTVPVKKGANPVELEVTLGEGPGWTAFGLATDAMVADGVDQTLRRQYDRLMERRKQRGE